MKKNSIWRYVWFSGLFLLLIIIYKLVITYKVEWETRDFNTYLYFYDCGDMICSSMTKPKTAYKKIICDDGVCPYVTDYSDKILVLSKDNISWLYDYETGEINNKYNNYELISDNLYIVTDENMKQGIIDKNDNVIISNIYDEIVEFGYGMVVYKTNNLCGIDYGSGEKIISPKYKDVKIINNTMYAAVIDSGYQIYNVVNNSLKSSSSYDYVWGNGKFLFVIRNKQIDILNNALDSNLLMKIDTVLSYKTNSEIKTLNIYSDDNYIYFTVLYDGNNNIKYKYDFINKKISTIE